MDEMVKTKKELVEFLKERRQYFIDYANPFQEATMVFYISNGLALLDKLDITDDTLVAMYDKDNHLEFRVEA